MAVSCVMKQLREKHISSEISKCLWSPKMDLMAIANVQGQVCLHRLSWQQVWVLNPPTENQKVTGLAWRHDSIVLSIGYTSGKVLLVNIEDSSVIHELDVKQEVSSLSWNKYTTANEEQSIEDSEEDPWAAYAYPLPPISKIFGETNARNPSDVWQEPRLLQDQTDLNVLCIGTSGGMLHLYAYGLFHIATVNIAETYPSVKKIVSIAPSFSLDYFSVVLEKEDEEKKLVLSQVILNTSLISSRHKELRSLAQKYGQIHSLMTYIGHTLTLIEDAWENALIEMDAKLANYAASVPEGGVSADFLDLLTFGHASAEFEIFLTNKLTEKNLKELRHSVDLCYSMMQRLVVKHLQQVGITLIFLLSQVEGMSQRKEDFSALGVHACDVEKAMGCVGSFLLKSSEMLEAIDSSMKDFHIFVRWVSSVHLRLLREHVPAELSRFSQQEMTSLLNFLNESFEEVVTGSDGEKRTHFRLERAGQYMKNEELKCLPHSEPTPFTKLINSNPALSSHKLIFIHNPRTSLIQEHEYLAKSLTKMGAQPGLSISSSIEIGECISVSPIESSYSLSQIAVQETSVICAFIPNVKRSLLVFLEWEYFQCQLKGGLFFVGGPTNSKNQLGMLDIQFYSPEALSLLLLDHGCPRNPFFGQVSVHCLRKEIDAIKLEGSTFVSEMNLRPLDLSVMPETLALRRLETGLAAKIAVSGPRKVAAVVGENCRRIRIYEMEVEDDDDDEDDDTKNESGNNCSGTIDELNDTL